MDSSGSDEHHLLFRISSRSSLIEFDADAEHQIDARREYFDISCLFNFKTPNMLNINKPREICRLKILLIAISLADVRLSKSQKYIGRFSGNLRTRKI